MRIIVNEFGKVGIDGKLLAPLKIALDEIAGGSIFCSCRSGQFEAALDSALRSSPELIIVEASGLSDPTGIYKLLTADRWRGRVAYAGCVCLADAFSPVLWQTVHA